MIKVIKKISDRNFMKNGVVRTPKKEQISHAEYRTMSEISAIPYRDRNRIAAMENIDYFSIKGISL